jgi:acylaminoacyl-peptidase
LFAAVGVLAGEVDRCRSAESIWRMRGLSAVEIHPDGKSAVVTVDWNDPMTDASYTDLYAVTAGGGARALTRGSHRNREARFSRDGSKLAYLSDRGGKTQIIVRDWASGSERALETGTEAPSQIAWSPDGKWIAYFQFVPEAPDWAPAMPAKPDGARWAPDAVAVTKLRWTFDGSGVARPGSSRIFAVSVDGGKPRQISSRPYFHTSYLFEPAELIWSADGSAVIAAAVQGEQDGWGNYQGGELYSFPLAGGKPTPLTEAKGHEALARVSPDGRWLAWSGFPWKHQGYTVTRLYVQPSAGGPARKLTGDWDRDVAAPTWAPDSDSIYHLSDDQGSTNLHRVKLDGTRVAVTRGERRLSSFSVARNGAIAAIESLSDQPARVVFVDVAGRATPVFDPNAEQFGGCRWSRAEEVRLTSFDDRKIQGWVVKPPGFDASKRYPMLVSIHGGPHGMYGVNFSHEFQMYAGRGYVVLYTNPRGSTGYGEEFGNVIQYRWPGDDIKDVLAAADHVIQQGYIDPQRTVVLGGSGGGLMTTWMVTETDRFQAAVALYPVTNWFTHIGSDDNGMFVGSVYRRAWGWQNPQDYMDRSPIFRVSKVKTPTMLITGEEDWRTPIAQSEEFYRALKVQGIDTVFVRVPGEGHGFRKHPSHRIASYVHASAWFEKYVGRE